MASVVHISHIFEESSCCLCGRTEVDQYLKLSNNFIKYKTELISLVEVIRRTLDFEFLDDTNSLEMCGVCKEKIVDFYHFKTKSLQVRKINVECSTTSTASFLQTALLDSFILDKAVYNTMEIVRDYIEKNPIRQIKVDLTADRLILIPKMSDCEDEEFTTLEEEVVLQSDLMDDGTYTEIEEIKQEEPETEYLEEFEDLIAEDLDDDETCPKYFEIKATGSENDGIPGGIIVEETQEYDEYDESMIYDSDASYYQQSVSEGTSDSKKSQNPRRPRNPETWLCNKRKSLRNSGQSYVSSTGKLMEARKMRESCGSSCRNKCITKITEEDRKRAFETIWGFGDVVKQRKWLNDRIISAEPKRRRTSNSMRKCTLQFYLDSRGSDGLDTLVQVCKLMFKNTLVVSSQMIQGVVNKYSKQGFTDSRGKFERKLSDGQRFAIEHVKRFPFFYIERTMTKVQCYVMYRNECLEKEIEPIKEGNYRDIFDRQNQGSFLKTEKIDCELCHQYNKATDQERASMQDEHDNHIKQGSNRKCRDRALAKIRQRRAFERRKSLRKSTNDKK